MPASTAQSRLCVDSLHGGRFCRRHAQQEPDRSPHHSTLACCEKRRSFRERRLYVFAEHALCKHPGLILQMPLVPFSQRANPHSRRARERATLCTLRASQTDDHVAERTAIQMRRRSFAPAPSARAGQFARPADLAQNPSLGASSMCAELSLKGPRHLSRIVRTVFRPTLIIIGPDASASLSFYAQSGGCPGPRATPHRPTHHARLPPHAGPSTRPRERS